MPINGHSGDKNPGDDVLSKAMLVLAPPKYNSRKSANNSGNQRYFNTN